MPDLVAPVTLPFPSLESVIERLHGGPHDVIVNGEAIWYATGVINRGLSDNLSSIGADAEWLGPNKLRIHFREPLSLYDFLVRLVELEIDMGAEFDPRPIRIVEAVLESLPS